MGCPWSGSKRVPELDLAGRQRTFLPSSLPSSTKVSQCKHHAGGTSCMCFAPATSPSASKILLAHSCSVFLILPIPHEVFFSPNCVTLCYQHSAGLRFFVAIGKCDFCRLSLTQSAVCMQNGWPCMYRHFYALAMKAFTHKDANSTKQKYKRN